MADEEKIKILKERRTKLFKECDELSEKIRRLENFLYSKRKNEISESQVNLLEVQFHIMQTYHRILRARIIDLNDEICELKK